MRIAVNVRFLIKNKLEGIGWFTYETLKRITSQHPEHQFFFFFDRPYDKSFLFSENITPLVLFPPARHPVLWYYWFEFAVPNALGKIKPDVFLSTDAFLSLRTNVNELLVIHDLAFLHFPAHINSLTSEYYHYFTPKYVRRADRIATVSEFSKSDLIKQYSISPEKIDVVYNAAGDLFHPLEQIEIENVRKKISNGSPYFIYAGAIQPRKNLVRIFNAFDLFKNSDTRNYKLVIAGRKAWDTKETMTTYENMRYKDDVIFLGHLQQPDLAKALASATALAYVSLFEGFGIPIVEAMQSHVPVITSSASSMPEVAGDAGLIVDPASVFQIAEAMQKIANDETLRKQMIEKGMEQVKKFTWQQSAERLWKSIGRTSNITPRK
jgi:glycosyltransferase involved in cell wall biosynthesis